MMSQQGGQTHCSYEVGPCDPSALDVGGTKNAMKSGMGKLRFSLTLERRPRGSEAAFINARVFDVNYYLTTR